MKKKLLSIILIASMALSLAACSNTKSDSEKDDTAQPTTTAEPTEAVSEDTTGEVKTIEVWSNNRHDQDYMTTMVEEFNAANENIKINYTILTDDWANSIQLAYQANTAPDVITMSASDGMTLNDYVKNGMFVNLADYIAADAEFQKVTEIYDHMYEGLNSIGEEIYWAPNGVRSGTRIQYNVGLIKAAGYDAVPATLSELVQLAKDVTANGNGETYGVGFTSSGAFGRWLEGVGQKSGYTNGGYDYKTGTFDFSSWKELVEISAQFFKDGSVLPGSETQGVDNSRALFAQGSFAIWGNASQEAGVFTDQFPVEFDWGVAEVPTVTGEVKGAQNITPNFAFTMLNSSKNKDAAWEVIKYFSGEDFLKGYFEGGYNAPLTEYMANIIDSSKVGRLADFALQEYEDVYPMTPAIALEGDNYATVFWNVILGNVTADEAIEDLNTRYNDALERGLANGSTTRLIIEDFDPLHPSKGTSTYSTN